MNAPRSTQPATSPLDSRHQRVSGGLFGLGAWSARALRVSAMVGAVVLAALVVGDAAFAQGLPETPPPEVRIQRPQAVWLGYVVMFLLTAVIITISLMPSKRAHQD